MAKAAVLMPYPELKETAEALLPLYPRITPMCVEYTETDQIEERVKQLAGHGCDLIVARGLQARVIREAVEIPVIEMRASTQELEGLVLSLRRQFPDDEMIRLGIIGFFNMFHSMELFNETLGKALKTDLRIYTATDIAQYTRLVDQAREDKCLGVIGGKTVCGRARALNLACRFLSMGEESMHEVLEAASRVAYSIDLLKRSNAEMSVMLDNTFDAVVQTKTDGGILRANRTFYQLAGSKPEQTVGRTLESVIGSLEEFDLQKAMQYGKQIDSMLVVVNHATALMNMSPVQVDGKISGAVFTFQEGARISEMDVRLRQNASKRSLTVQNTFENQTSRNGDYQRLLEQARKLSRHDVAVLLQGEPGTGKGILAECIHNGSLWRNGPFVVFDCSIWHPDDLDEKLFGRFSAKRDTERSVVQQAMGGTLYLRHVELLGTETQYKLCCLIHGNYLHNAAEEGIPAKIRVIASTECDLYSRVKQKLFRSDLYYALGTMCLHVPPLRQRQEDILSLWQKAMTRYNAKYHRQMHLTDDAVDFLCMYGWPGNMDQMENLCNRLTLLAAKRSVDAETLREHLDAPQSTESFADSDVKEYANNAQTELLEALKRFHGTRDRTAADLGISKTTLWRRMKQCGIARDLSTY